MSVEPDGFPFSILSPSVLTLYTLSIYLSDFSTPDFPLKHGKITKTHDLTSFICRIRTFKWLSAFDVLQFYGWWISETDVCQHEWHKTADWDLCASAEMTEMSWDGWRGFGEMFVWTAVLLASRMGSRGAARTPCRGDEHANWLWLSPRILCQTFQADGLWTTHMKAAGIYGKWSSVLTCGSRRADTPLTGPHCRLPPTLISDL